MLILPWNLKVNNQLRKNWSISEGKFKIKYRGKGTGIVAGFWWIPSKNEFLDTLQAWKQNVLQPLYI